MLKVKKQMLKVKSHITLTNYADKWVVGFSAVLEIGLSAIFGHSDRKYGAS
ncbi:hypothetical protein [Aeromonas sp. R5-3]|uniref:hypothetical protein n=1 Tax=Aeromonas sp. R5-3 TaxID=3138469 RepID=UPI0034A584AA